MQQIIDEFHASMSFQKVFALLQKVFPDEVTLNAKLDQVGESQAKAAPDLSSLTAQMTEFRKDVGEDMWATIAANPSLPKLIEQWSMERYQKVVKTAAAAVKALIPADQIGDLTEKDFIGFVIFSAKLAATG